VSAVEEYKRATFGLRDAEPSTLAGIDHVREKADAAIAELDAKCKDLMKRLWTSEERAAGMEATKKTLSEGVKTRDAELLNRTRAIAAWETNSDMQQSRIADLEADHASLAYAYDGRYRELLEARASLQQAEAELAKCRKREWALERAREEDAIDHAGDVSHANALRVQAEAENEQLQEDHTAVMGDYIHEVQRVNEAEATIERALAVGHNDDCIFCGLKDKELSRWAERGTK